MLDSCQKAPRICHERDARAPHDCANQFGEMRETNGRFFPPETCPAVDPNKLPREIQILPDAEEREKDARRHMHNCSAQERVCGRKKVLKKAEAAI